METLRCDRSFRTDCDHDGRRPSPPEPSAARKRILSPPHMVWPPMVRPVSSDTLRSLQELHANNASNKAADVRPECNPAATADLRKPADQLEKQPVKQHHPSRKC